MKRTAFNIGTVLGIYFILEALFIGRPADAFINTIYTIAGIMFSIGMGIIGTINLDRVLNKDIYKILKRGIVKVRTNYMAYFSAITIPYLLCQMVENDELIFQLNILSNVWNLSIDLATFTISINIIAIAYFILNFVEIQKLNFEISEKSFDRN
jgi:hypothetical protein